MRIGIAREIAPGERRVAAVPDSVGRLVRAGFDVFVESGAGEAASVPDAAFRDAGAQLLRGADAVYGQAEIVLKVVRPLHSDSLGRHEVELMTPGTVVTSFYVPSADPGLLPRLTEHRLTLFSMDLIPRLSRAQPMDARSAMSVVAGYKAVVIAANLYPRFFPLLSTAAGTVPPAKVLVLGVGVAGLQAIATARRLGAMVSAFDVRPAVREQVESLGARFLSVDVASEEIASGYAKGLSADDELREREQIAAFVHEADVVITSAFVPGKRAPLLITEEAVTGMKPGSLIVDLATEQGGNCALTRSGEQAIARGVTIIGPVNLPSAMPAQASQWYARTVCNFLLNMWRDGRLDLDADDPIVRESCVAREGRIVVDRTLVGPGVRGGDHV
jgi:NAD(P) transhydrogenase subunit alpha